MSWLEEWTLLRPWWLLALPAIAAAAMMATRRAAPLGDWRRRIDPALMQAMTALGRVEGAGGRAATLAPFIAAGLIALALSGPAQQRADGRVFRNLDGVVFVVDVSASLAADPAWPQAVVAAQTGLAALGTEPAALIVFAGDSYVATPLTTERREIAETITLLDARTVPDKGSRPGPALARAASMLARASVLAGEVVLITDGGGLGPGDLADALAPARAVAAGGGRLSVVHVATAGDVAPPAAPEALAALAAAGGGAVFDARRDLGRLGATLREGADSRLAAETFRLLFWTDHGRWLLIVALLPLGALFRRDAA